MQYLKNEQARSGTKKKIVLYLLLFPGVLALFLFIISSFSSPQWRLVVEAPLLDRSIYSLPVDSGDVFEMHYLHSVSNRTIQGSFAITGSGDIKPLATIFDSFGPGLPELDGSLEYEILNGDFIVYHDEEPREELSLFVAPLTEDRLYLNDEQYDLASLFETSTLIKIYATSE